MSRWLQAESVLFYGRVSKPIGGRPVGDEAFPTAIEYANLASYDFFGGEVHLRAQPHPRLTATLHYGHRQFAPAPQSNVPARNLLDLSLFLGLARDLEASASLHHTTSYRVYETAFPGEQEEVEPYTLLNVAGSYRLWRSLKATVAVENLFDRRHTEFGVAEVGRQVVGRLEIAR